MLKLRRYIKDKKIEKGTTVQSSQKKEKKKVKNQQVQTKRVYIPKLSVMILP